MIFKTTKEIKEMNLSDGCPKINNLPDVIDPTKYYDFIRTQESKVWVCREEILDWFDKQIDEGNVKNTLGTNRNPFSAAICLSDFLKLLRDCPRTDGSIMVADGVSFKNGEEAEKMAEIKAHGLISNAQSDRSESLRVNGQTSTCGSICDSSVSSLEDKPLKCLLDGKEIEIILSAESKKELNEVRKALDGKMFSRISGSSVSSPEDKSKLKIKRCEKCDRVRKGGKEQRIKNNYLPKKYFYMIA